MIIKMQAIAAIDVADLWGRCAESVYERCLAHRPWSYLFGCMTMKSYSIMKRLTRWLERAGALSCTPCSPGTYSASTVTGPGPLARKLRRVCVWGSHLARSPAQNAQGARQRGSLGGWMDGWMEWVHCFCFHYFSFFKCFSCFSSSTIFLILLMIVSREKIVSLMFSGGVYIQPDENFAHFYGIIHLLYHVEMAHWLLAVHRV